MTPRVGGAFEEAVRRTYLTPPVDDGQRDGPYAHRYLGRHATFQGRRYRRGTLRCRHCGAWLTSPDGSPDPFRHLSPLARMQHAIFTPSPLYRWITPQR